MNNLYDLQSVFRFSLRLPFHTSCSYRVHESCLRRVSSLQNFKQNESRTSCSSSNYCNNFQKNKLGKERQKRKVGMKPWLKRRENLGFYETVPAELQLEDAYNFQKYL